MLSMIREPDNIWKSEHLPYTTQRNTMARGYMSLNKWIDKNALQKEHIDAELSLGPLIRLIAFGKKVHENKRELPFLGQLLPEYGAIDENLLEP